MRKEDGAAIMVRPASNEGLRREVEELGSQELARMHICHARRTLPYMAA